MREYVEWHETIGIPPKENPQMSFESDHEPYQPVETVRATILTVIPDPTFGKCYYVKVEELGQMLEIPLPAERHGQLKNKLRHTFYKGDEINQGIILPAEPVATGDRIDLHLALRGERVVRWQKARDETTSVAA